MVHGSDSPSPPQREIGIFFPELACDRRARPRLSASPQRRAILEQLGIAFAVRPRTSRSSTEGDPLWSPARTRAARPRRGPRAADELVLGVDTLVALDGEILGKPADADAGARARSRRLAGRTHQVVGGVALRRGRRRARRRVETTG